MRKEVDEGTEGNSSSDDINRELEENPSAMEARLDCRAGDARGGVRASLVRVGLTGTRPTDALGASDEEIDKGKSDTSDA